MDAEGVQPPDDAARSAAERYRYEHTYDEHGVDVSLIVGMLRLTPLERLRRMDKARRDALRLMQHGRDAGQDAA